MEFLEGGRSRFSKVYFSGLIASGQLNILRWQKYEGKKFQLESLIILRLSSITCKVYSMDYLIF